MSLDGLPPAEVMWVGKFIRAIRRGKWEYASRTRNIGAVVILAEFEGRVILIDQPRIAPDCRCVELPAGLVGDNDPDATVEATAIKELEEETGFTADC
ncbi:MAG TPA: NUDIX hydrolase, partial [Sphingomicrobium sp.]|nr:NUDIX hydrolase [Sphingomicrobium sp.]